NDTDHKELKKELDELTSFMEDETEGEAKVLFDNLNTEKHELEDFTVTLEGYRLLELNDFHHNFNIRFDDNTDGGVILAKYRYTNYSDKDLYSMPTQTISFTGSTKANSTYHDLLPEDKRVQTELGLDDDFLVKKGETKEGYMAYPFSPEDLKEMHKLKTVSVEVKPAQEEAGKHNNPVGKEDKFTLSTDEEGAKKAEKNSKFYKDRVTSKDMGEKKMLEEKDGIDKTEKLGDVAITLDGYQFTEFEPNKEESTRFKNFENGIVLLTVKFDLKNEGDQTISKSSISSKLHQNDGKEYSLNEGMLTLYNNTDNIKQGDEDELLQVFTIDAEQYEKILKNKSFEVEIGPMRDKEAKDISKGKAAKFKLK